MKKIFTLVGILLLASCTKDEMFLEIEEQIQETKKDSVNITTTTPTTANYVLYKESYLNQRSGIAFTWSEQDSRIYGYQSTLIYKGNRQVNYYAGGQAYHDVNGDGFQDILVTNHNRDEAWTCWYINTGDNYNFTSDESYILNSTEGYSSYKFIKTDVNNDGKADFIAFGVDERVKDNYNGNLTVFIQNSDGKFLVNNIPNPKKYWFHTGAAGDLNGDGNTDLIAAETIWWGDGKGNFSEADNNLSMYAGAVLAYEILDINKDGLNDIILGTQTEHGQDVIILNQNNKFDNSNKTIKLSKTEYSGIMDIEIVDIDNDGDLDIIELRQGNSNISLMILYKNENNVFNLIPNYFPESLDGDNINGEVDRFGWSRFKFDDVDKDGQDEILAENFHDGKYNALKKIDGSWKKVTLKFGK